jgi:hypothetical protein
MARLAALSCAVGLFLACGVSGAEAVVAPVEGPWHGTTSAGLPIAFEVGGGQVAATHFRFRWGFCGSFEEGPGATVAIEQPSGHWKYLASQGPYVEATFVAPNRVEGTVVAPSRMLPGCPETKASFVAEPGAAPFPIAPSLVRYTVNNRRLVKTPGTMVMKRDGSMRFYDLHWKDFGEETATATGRARLRSSCPVCPHRVVEHPRVTLTLSELTQQGNVKVYLQLEWDFHGQLPPGFRQHGERFLE